MPTAILSTVTKAFRVLELFREHPSLSLSECAKLLEMPRPTAHRLLVTLESTGVVERNLEGRYQLGLRMFEIGALAPGRCRLYDASCHPLEQLVDLTGMPCHLTLLDGDEVVYLVKAHRVARDRTETRAGSRRPAHATAAGRVLLAHQGPQETARLVAGGLAPLTRHTVIVASVFLQVLAEVRRTGHAVEREEVRLGCASVAVPVRGVDGEVVAALSVDGPVGQADRMVGHTGSLHQAAAVVEGNLRRDARRAVA